MPVSRVIHHAALVVLLLSFALVAPVSGQTIDELLEELREPLPAGTDEHALTILEYYRRSTTPPVSANERPRMLRLEGTRRTGREVREFRVIGSARGQLHETEFEKERYRTKLTIRAYNGELGWKHDPEWLKPKNRQMSGTQTENLLDDYRLLFPLDWMGDFVAYQYRGRIRRTNPAQVMVRAFRADGRYVDLSFSSRGYLLVKAEWRDIYAGSIMPRSWHFTGWEEHSGRWVPRQVDLRMADRRVGSMVIDKVIWEPAVPVNIFDMPPTRTVLLTNEAARQLREEAEEN